MTRSELDLKDESGARTGWVPTRPLPARGDHPTEALWALRSTQQWSRAELVRRYMPLARQLAARYRGANEPFEDLVQVANLGLVKAVDRFDHEYGAAFVSFATPTILGELRRYFRDTGWAVRVPRDTQELAIRIERTASVLTENLGRSPRISELADYMKLSLEQVLDGLEAANAHFGSSLDAPAGERQGERLGTLLDVLGDDDEGYALVDALIDLGSGVQRLPHRERTALLLRCSEDLKQSEIAKRMGCSQMQVSRLLARAAQRLRAAAPDGDPDRSDRWAAVKGTLRDW